MLLHEEFAKPTAEMRTERMSRHLYDLERMLHADIAERALSDEHLYRSVLEHRRKFIGLKGFDPNTTPQSKQKYYSTLRGFIIAQLTKQLTRNPC